jgi:hypothetical protein
MADNNKGGRPRKEINIETLRNAVRIQCTAEECAGLLQVSEDTIDRRLREEGYEGFADFYKSHSAEGKASLRRQQWKAAEAGNPTMLVWLGKQWLGQRDQVSVDNTSSDRSMSPKGSDADALEQIHARLDRLASKG